MTDRQLAVIKTPLATSSPPELRVSPRSNNIFHDASPPPTLLILLYSISLPPCTTPLAHPAFFFPLLLLLRFLSPPRIPFFNLDDPSLSLRARTLHIPGGYRLMKSETFYRTSPDTKRLRKICRNSFISAGSTEINSSDGAIGGENFVREIETPCPI